MFEFKIPEVGENIKSGTVVNIFVKVGDVIKKGQDVLELETDKASLPVPSTTDGIVKEILIKVGQEVKIGQVALKVESTSNATTEKQKAPVAPIQEATKSPNNQITQSPTEIKTTNYDTKLAIIGGGPGGYTAAFLAADLGLDVTLVNSDKNPGGVCLYKGCIPSKALLHAAKILSESKEAKHFGIEFAEPKVDINKLRSWKNDVVEKLTGGLGQLSKQRKIKYIQGYATLTNANTLKIKNSDGTQQTLTFEKAIVATGSSPIELPIAPKSPRILDSTSALDMENIPKTMLLIGGGYIGLELGTVYAQLGTQLDVVEVLPQLMMGADRDISSVLEKRLRTILREIMIETKVTELKETPTGILVTFLNKDGSINKKEYEKVLVAIGRKPNTKNIGLENTKVKVTDRGFIEVDGQRQTTEPSIYAIGDVTGQPMLAHKASHEGITAVEVIAGHKAAFEPKTIPAVVFTDPEIAWCGLTETEAKAAGREYVVAKFPWGASGRAMTLDRGEGLTKILVDPENERILGISIVGHGAGELIAEGVLAIEMGATVTDLKMTIHPHPTLSETLMETAESFFGQSTHIFRPKK